MAGLDIIRTELTPMQRLVVEWEPVVPAPVSYTVTATNAGHTVTETVAGDVTVARLAEQLPLLRTYTVTVSDGTTTGPAAFQEIEVKCGVANLLRQAVFDAIYDAGIIDRLGRSLVVYENGLFRPDDVLDGEVVDTSLPAFEVQMPVMSGTPVVESGIRRTETWEVPFRIWDEGTDNNPESIEDAYHILELVQVAIEATEDLNLSARGVMWRGWDFTAPEQIEGRDRISGLSCSIIVPVQRLRAAPSVS